MDRKWIVKILPAGMEQEPGRHEAAWHSNENFSEQHFARQPVPPFPVGDDDERFLLLQEVAGDLIDYRPLNEASPVLRAEVGAAVVRLMLRSWNGKRWPERPEISRAIVANYLGWELRTKIGEIEDWAVGKGLASRGQEWIDGPGERLPNPIGMVLTGLSVHRVIVDYIWGLTHGDLHQGNVLVPYSELMSGEPVEALSPSRIRLIDLAGFDPAAPLTRDLVTLSLSLVAVEFGGGRGMDDSEALLQTLLDGGTSRRPLTGLAGRVRVLLSAVDSVPGSLLGEWRAQYLLSLLAGALAHTTYENVGDTGRRWFFTLAARAAAEFVKFAELHRMIPPEPENEDQPDQIVVGVVFAEADRAAAFELRDRLLEHAGNRRAWDVNFLRRREENRSATDDELRSPHDLLLRFLSLASLGDPACEREVTAALSRGVPVIAIRSDSDNSTLGDPDVPVVDLAVDDEAGFDDLIGRIVEVASAKRVQRRILADLEQSEEEERRAEGAQRRRFGFFNREQRVRLEEERRRAGPLSRTAQPEPHELTGTAVSPRNVRLVNEAPGIPAATFHDRVTEMHQVEDATADPAVGLVVVAGEVGAGKTAFAAEMRRRLALGEADVAVDAVVYLSADGYRAITVATVLSDLVASLADDEERQRLNRRLHDPIAWQEKLTEVLAALGSRKVVVILDAAEHLLNRDGDFRDQDLHRFLRRFASQSGHQATVILTVAGGLPPQLRREPDPPVRVVKLQRGLPFNAAMDFLLGLDRTAVLGMANLPDRDRLRVHAVTLGHPRTLELLVGVLHQRPASTAADLLDELEQVDPGDTATVLFDWMFAELTRTEERVVQALAACRRPVPPDAVDHVLVPYVHGINSEPVLRGLHDQRVVRHDHGHYFMPPSESDRVLEGIPFGELDDHSHQQPPFTRISLWRRGADYFELHRPTTITDLQDLRSMFSEVDLRIKAWDFYNALVLMKNLDDRYLRPWGQSDALVEWRREIRGQLHDPDWEAHNRSYLVAALQQREETDDALEELRVARAGLSWHGSPRNRISLSIEMAKVRFDSGEIRGAGQDFRRYLRLARLVGGMRFEQTVARLNLAVCLAKTGDFTRALRQFVAARECSDGLSDAEQNEAVPMLLADHAWALGQINEMNDALALLQEGRLRASAAFNEIGVGMCRNGEAAVLIDSGRARDAVTPAREAAEIGARTRDPGLTRQANLNLGLAQLILSEIPDAFATAEVSARIDRGPRAIGACGLLGITAFRLGERNDARSAFQTARAVAGEQVKREDCDYQAWDALGVVYFGMALIEYEQRSQFLKYAGRAFAKARRIARADGAANRNRILLNCFATEPDLAESMSKVADGGPSPFG
jgi:tetratricopeptide (TPR) repeat protein